MALLSSPLSLSNSQKIRIRTGLSSCKKKIRQFETMVKCSNHQMNDNTQKELCYRRDMMLFGLTSSLALVLPPSGYSAEEVKMDTFVDDINAYSYKCPTMLPTKKLQLKWAQSRNPAIQSVIHQLHLSPVTDARLRIVSERVNFIDNLIISITIGPPNKLFLKTMDKSTWTAKAVADSVLSDKSALRVTSTQRMAESSVLDTHSADVEGEPYWYYEYLVRKSPTKVVNDSNNFRHYISATAERDGFLYSLSASTLNKQWDVMGPALEQTAASFCLLPLTDNYVPPYKDSWRFW